MMALSEASIIAAVATAFTLAAPPVPARADVQCPYPMIGVLGVQVGPVTGGFCDGPTEINGSHWHCQGGGLNLGLGFVGNLSGMGGGLGFAQSGAGVGGLSCNFKCADGVDAPQPNPPGQWREYLVPMNTTNYCKDHMAPNGFWSAPVLATEGIPPAGQPAPAPGETLPPQPIPPPLPTMPESPPPVAPLAPGEPNP